MTNPTSDEMKFALEAPEARVDARLANFDTSVKTGFAELRAEIADLRTDIAKQGAEMHRGMADLLKWGSGIALAAVVATVGLLTYINKSADKPQPWPTAAPIVIYAQPQPAATSSVPVTPAPAPPR